MGMIDENILEMIFMFEGVSGRYTDHPDDAGGPTRWGITVPVLAKHRGKLVTWKDVMELSQEEAEDIYRQRYIRPFILLPDNIRPNVTDMGVNSGISRALKLLQQTCGADVDGVLGKQTLRFADKQNWNPLYVGVRLGFYESLIVAKPTNLIWRNGWRRRALWHLEDHATVLRFASPQPFAFVGKAA